MPAETVAIRCIRDNVKQKVLGPWEDSDAEESLTLLHASFDVGRSDRYLETQFQLYQNSFARGDYWIIPIHALPYEDSWQQNFPQQLVRAALCSRDTICRVSFRRN